MGNQKRIKVLHIITRLDPGGSSTNTIETVTRLNKEKYETFLISGRTNEKKEDVLNNLNRKKVSYLFIDELVREISPLNDLKAFTILYKHIKQNKYDIVHTHSSKAGILGRWAAKLAGTKYVVHTPHGHVFYGYFNSLITRIFIYIERLTAFITDKIITLTKKGKEEHLLFKIGPPGKFEPIYSGIDLELFKNINIHNSKKRNDLSINHDAFIFGTVTRLDPIKGNEYLIRAFAIVCKKLKNSILLIIGNGEQKEYLKLLVDELNIKNNVIFLGFRDDVIEILHILDIFVLFSINEGMGRVILEAMACGIPVIASKTGGIPEIITQNSEGLLVAPKDIKGLSDAMIKLANDEYSLKLFSENARKKVNEIFGIDKMVSDIDNLYESVINK